VVTPDTREALVALLVRGGQRSRRSAPQLPTTGLACTGNAQSRRRSGHSGRRQAESATIKRSSGSPKLDQAALNILKLASPFDPFPKELAEKYRLLRFTYQWEFEGGRSAQGTVTAPADSR
jgi:protein TonB